jgi:hypothetical protein
MTAPLRSTALPSGTQTASQTAPVAEFRCLFTHDVKRKQKRWQDGFLKFHTFNSRVMVCDQARNHIGDTYWKDSSELQEGDELSLDRGVLVEVAEAMGVTQTDLAPLLKKTRESTMEGPSRPAPSAPVRPFQRPTPVAPSNTVRAGTQLRHKSLNTLLGTPKGPAGKAVPMKSPYDSRKEQGQEQEIIEERAPKRQKVTPRPTAWRASSPAHEDLSSPVKPAPLWARTANAKSGLAATPRPVQVITIPSETDHIPFASSDVTLPSPPARIEKLSRMPPVSLAPRIPSPVFHEPLEVETPKLPPTKKIRLPKSRPIETPKRPSRDLSPPVSASNRLANVDFAVQSVQNPPTEPTPPPSLVRNPKAKSLRLSAGVKRATLLCQSIPQPPSRAGCEASTSTSKSSIVTAPHRTSKESSTATSNTGGSASRNNAESRSRTSPSAKSNRTALENGAKAVRNTAKPVKPIVETSADVFDDPEIMHGLMDQQLLVLSSPVEQQSPPLSPPNNAPVSKPKAKPGAKKASNHIEILTPELTKEVPVESKQIPAKKVTKRAQSVKKTVEKPQAARADPPPLEAVFEPPAPPPREISPTLSNASGATSRNTSTSPTKKVLSTGGFRKKPKPISKEAVAKAPIQDVFQPPPLRIATAPPPPQSIRSSKKGPLMSTTELAALLAKPKKRSCPDDDPIEESSQPPGKSPARKIRRVRSENDVPIPSTAEDWEKRNLPKTSSHLAEGEAMPPPEAKKKVSALAALVKRTDPRKKFARTQSLGIDTSGAGAYGEGDLPSPVLDGDIGPWSTEAFDLFDWRPPAVGGEDGA